MPNSRNYTRRRVLLSPNAGGLPGLVAKLPPRNTLRVLNHGC